MLRRLLLYLLFIFYAHSGSAQAREWLIFEDLSRSWLVYESNENVYLPFLPDYHSNRRQIHLQLDIEKYAGKTLQLYSFPPQTSIFINNHLVHLTKPDKVLLWNLDSLAAGVGATKFLLTCYTPNAFEKTVFAEVVMVSPYMLKAQHNNITENKPIKNRVIAKQHSFMILASVALLFVMGMLATTVKLQFSLVGLWNMVESFLQGKNQSKRISVVSNALFFIYFSCSVGIFVAFLGIYTKWIPFFQLPTQALSLGLFFNKMLLAIFAASLFLVIKYVAISVMTTIYKDRQLSSLHIQEYMHISQVFCVIITVMTVAAASVAAQVTPLFFEILTYIFLGLWLLKILLMTYRINSAFSYKKIYLFSYLCATEYIPVLLSAKILINW